MTIIFRAITLLVLLAPAIGAADDDASEKRDRCIRAHTLILTFERMLEEAGTAKERSDERAAIATSLEEARRAFREACSLAAT